MNETYKIESRPNWRFILTTYTIIIPLGISGWGVIISLYYIYIKQDLDLNEFYTESFAINGSFFLISFSGYLLVVLFSNYYYKLSSIKQWLFTIICWIFMLVTAWLDLNIFF
ncbi:MAG: hypothetical protein COA79_17440 [Planctomycetota bacterium]|nr:MAG: hypothetical protein COA79_17440 [Planctomycetota bacterium]